jgi:hypothetical protein
MASTMASSDSVLMLNPAAYISVKTPMSEIGIVTMGMIEARNERRKKKITSTTRTIASRMVMKTALIERSMKTASSLPISASMPSGSEALRSGKTARVAFETSSGLATACLMMPTMMAGRPS